MTLDVVVTANELEPDQIASSARALLKEIREGGLRASLASNEPVTGEKGAAEILGQIAVAAVSAGAINTLIQTLFNFITRNRKLSIELKQASGASLTINADYLDSKGRSEVLNALSSFMGKNKNA